MLQSMKKSELPEDTRLESVKYASDIASYFNLHLHPLPPLHTHTHTNFARTVRDTNVPCKGRLHSLSITSPLTVPFPSLIPLPEVVLSVLVFHPIRVGHVLSHSPTVYHMMSSAVVIVSNAAYRFFECVS